MKPGRFSIKPHELRFDFLKECGIPGTFAVVVTWADFPAPIAMVWYRFGARRGELDVVNSWVEERARRLGIRSRVNSFLFDAYARREVARIVTQTGSASGRAFMRRTGYTQARDGHWYITRLQWARYMRKRGDG